MFSQFRELMARWDLVLILISRNLKIRYKNSVLGFFWSLLTPLIFIAIYAVFARILKFSADNPRYMPFLITGIIVWQFLGTCLGDSLRSIAGNANLVKKTAFPRIVLPITTVAANLVNFFLTVVVLEIYLLIEGIAPVQVLWILPVVFSHFALCLGLALIISAVNVFFRDTEHIISVFTLAWFFLTPIFYPLKFQLDFLPDHVWLLFLNPMTGILSVYRLVLLGEPLVGSWTGPLISFGVSWFILAAGVVVFSRLDRRFADEL